MLPLSALILLGTVSAVTTGTFCFAIYYTVRTKVESRRKQQEEESSLPLTEATGAVGTDSGSLTHLPPAPRPPTPEAEEPPPLPGEFDDATQRDYSVKSSSLARADSPPALLPATTYCPTPPPSTSPGPIYRERLSPNGFRPPTPEADFPPPLPKSFPGIPRAISPAYVPPHSPLLPPPPAMPPTPRSMSATRGRNRDEIQHSPRNTSNSRSRTRFTEHGPHLSPRGRPRGPPPGPRARMPPNSDQRYPRFQPQQRLPHQIPAGRGEADRPDSMHEIYDIYSQLPPPTPKFMPKSAPAFVTTFTQAESKSVWVGQKREGKKDAVEVQNWV